MTERLVTIYDRAGRLIEVSPSFADVFGPEVFEYIGRRPPYPWWSAENREVMMELFETVIGEEGGEHDGLEVIVTMRTRTQSINSYVVYCESLSNGSTKIVGRPLVQEDRVSRAIDLLRESLISNSEGGFEAPQHYARVELLSPRERNVYTLLREGYATAAIADMLYVSIHTVRNHRKAIYRKLGVSSQIELIRTIEAS